MNFEYLKDWKKNMPRVLVLLTVLLAVAAGGRVLGFELSSIRMGKRIESACPQSKQEDAVEKSLAKRVAVADELKKKNIFVLPVVETQPVTEVAGILGNEALLNGKWYKVGDKVSGVTILAIEPTQIKIEWNGKEIILSPNNAKAKSEPSRGNNVTKKVKKKGGAKNIKATEVVEVEAVVAEEDPLAWLGIKLSPAMRAKFLEKWNSMTDEQKKKTKEQWNSMTDEQKQAAVKAWESM